MSPLRRKRRGAAAPRGLCRFRCVHRRPPESAWDSTGPATQQCPCRGGHHGQAVSRQRRTRRRVHLTAVPTPLPSPRAARRPWNTPVSVVPLPSSDSPASASPASAPPQQRPVLSVAEAADLLGVSQWLVLRQVGRGAIPHKRVGRRILFPRAGFLAWLESTDQESSDQPGPLRLAGQRR